MSDDGQTSEDEDEDDEHALMDFVSYPDSDSDYSTDEEIIELAEQKSAVNELTRLPEKVGQVIIFFWWQKPSKIL